MLRPGSPWRLCCFVGHEKCVLVGHDWGGAVAWSYTAMYPERVKRLITCNSPHPTAIYKHMKSSLSQLCKSWYVFDSFNNCKLTLMRLCQVSCLWTLNHIGWLVSINTIWTRWVIIARAGISASNCLVTIATRAVMKWCERNACLVCWVLTFTTIWQQKDAKHLASSALYTWILLFQHSVYFAHWFVLNSVVSLPSQTLIPFLISCAYCS